MKPPLGLTKEDFDILHAYAANFYVAQIIRKMRINYAKEFMCIEHALWQCGACMK